MKEVLYVVNNDSATSIPLEIAGQINQQRTDFQPIVYYQESSGPKNEFVRDVINIGAYGPFDVKAWLKVIRFIRFYKPKVIHAHHTFSTFIFFFLGKIFYPDVKLIKTVHTSNYSFRWDQKVINFFIYVIADKILCNSQTTMNSFSYLEKKIGSHKTEVVYNGVDLNRIKKPDTLDKNGNLIKKKDSGVIVGSVGRLVKVKDYTTLIEAFNVLCESFDKEMTLLLVGDGKERNNLERLVVKKELSDRVIFTGAVERKVVYNLLRQIDIFVISSLAEGFCNTLVEALAAERAVVCSDIPTLKEVGGDAVLFAEPGNPASFSNAINRLLENKELFGEMRERAGMRAKKFTLEACAEKYMNHYS